MILIPILIQLIYSVTTLTTTEPIENGLDAYFKALQRCGSSSCFYMFNSSNYTYTNRFLEGCSIFIISAEKTQRHFAKFKFDSFFIFVDKIGDFVRHAQYLTQSYLWNPQTKTHFIIREFIAELRDLPTSLYGYKPLNLNRNQLRVGYFLREPHFYEDENGQFEGTDKTVFELFAYFLNASLEIEISGNMSDPDPTIKTVEAINRGETDILANRIIQWYRQTYSSYLRLLQLFGQLF
nr:unnamed protein product [Callosobruchus analis]